VPLSVLRKLPTALREGRFSATTTIATVSTIALKVQGIASTAALQ
jgi:hypothetical protein